MSTTALRRVRVLLADDSAWVRKHLPTWLAPHPDIEVVGSVIDPVVAREKIPRLRPDIVLLDIGMPREDSFDFIAQVAAPLGLPVIIIHPRMRDGSEAAIAALRAGAFDIFEKPESGDPSSASMSSLARKIREASRFSPQRDKSPAPQARPSGSRFDSQQVILLGASTGGTEALASVLTQLPEDMPGICVVQHIPANFSRSFANRLNELCQLEVREAIDGDQVSPGLVLVAPGDYHMTLHRAGNGYRVRLNQGDRVHHQRPAVDELFFSAEKSAGRHAIAAVLTGMGRDGALGLKALRDAGARTFAQDEATSVVFGMPQAAWKEGGAEKLLPLNAVAPELMRLAHAMKITTSTATSAA